jgi:hypothetical protein
MHIFETAHFNPYPARSIVEQVFDEVHICETAGITLDEWRKVIRHTQTPILTHVAPNTHVAFMPKLTFAIIFCQVWKLHPELLEMMSVDGLVKMVLFLFKITNLISDFYFSDEGLTMAISPYFSLQVRWASMWSTGSSGSRA